VGPMNQYVREPINGFTHLIGAILSFIALLAMVIKAALTTASPLVITSVIIFGISMTLLYAASATYHMVLASDKVIAFLRRIDHSMIYLLIAGSYAPFCLIALNGTVGWTIFTTVAVLAIAGIVFKLVWFNAPRWLSTALYIFMGWIIIFAIYPLSQSLAPAGFFLLLAGGIMYTIGGVIYGINSEKIRYKQWGPHEIFHIFIMLGTLCHFLSVYFFVIH